MSKTKSILVTGANKGIGLGIVRRILNEIDNSFVYLASRDAERGLNALNSILSTSEAYKGRMKVVELDVADDKSVKLAAETVAKDLKDHPERAPLFAIVNNAGMANNDLPNVLNVNVHGVRRVSEQFMPLLNQTEGRIVNIGSAAGPMVFSGATQERKDLLLNPNVTWEELTRLMDEAMAAHPSKEKLDKLGFGAWDDRKVYSLSKAIVHAYTVQLAREHKSLIINACTPGFIATDLVFNNRIVGDVTEDDKKNEEFLKSKGLKTPNEGAKSTLRLLTAPREVIGTGRYFGSDGLRSPMHKYRSPGDPEYTGEDN